MSPVRRIYSLEILQSVCLGFAHIPDIGPIPLKKIIEQKFVYCPAKPHIFMKIENEKLNFIKSQLTL